MLKKYSEDIQNVKKLKFEEDWTELRPKKVPKYYDQDCSLTTINPLGTANFGKILHIFAASMKMLQTLSLILEN